MKLEAFFEKAWSGYSELTPDAPLIHELLKKRGESIVNDHVAFRTFNLPGIGRLELGRVFEQWGYKRANEELDFPEKQLKANYWLHSDPKQPKIFISELLVERFPSELQQWIRSLGAQINLHEVSSPEFFLRQTWKPIRFSDYEKFYPQSEYAAWTAAFGIRVNHFTVFVNSLKTFKSLQDLNQFLVQEKILLNDSGGVIKGTPQELLEQSSTKARKIPWLFDKGVKHAVMGCYYEFARRYPIPGSKELFQGFIPKSADKIFESTFEKVR